MPKVPVSKLAGSAEKLSLAALEEANVPVRQPTLETLHILWIFTTTDSCI